MTKKDDNYIVLARKYRPKKLSDIIGQGEASSIIYGAVKLKRVAHAFLFSGTRGVGKTTFARILAKILNCTKVNQDNKDPCEECSNCISIENESNIDVVEIDAASKTGVSDVREIIENINYKPVQAKKKIFIIDEVHMLSKAAFNALLKTLEEPPLDVVFIFATTETEKIPVTILSRCQRFTLRRVEIDMISKHLIDVGEKEGYKIDEDSSRLIALASEGSMRDALSILENIFAKNEKISLELVREVIGLTDSSLAINLFEHLCKGDVKSALTQFDDLYKKGISIDQLAKSLMDFSHKLALIKSGENNNFKFVDSNLEKRLKKISLNYEMDFIIRFWELMQKYVNELSSVFDEKQCFEMIIMRLCYASLIPTPFEILNKTNEKSNDKSDGKDIVSEIKNKENNTNEALETSDYTGDNLARDKANDFYDEVKEKNNEDDNLKKFSNLVELIEKKSEMLISYHLKNSFRLVNFLEPMSNKNVGSIELENINGDIDSKKILWTATKLLENITGQRWVLSISNKVGCKSLNEKEKQDSEIIIDTIKKNKIIKKILEIIPSSEVVSIKPIEKTIKEKNND